MLMGQRHKQGVVPLAHPHSLVVEDMKEHHKLGDYMHLGLLKNLMLMGMAEKELGMAGWGKVALHSCPLELPF